MQLKHIPILKKKEIYSKRHTDIQGYYTDNYICSYNWELGKC